MNELAKCACGALQVRITADPVHLVACHCKDCQGRTGSAYGVSCIVEDKAFEHICGDVSQYKRLGDTGGWVLNNFCPTCGTSVFWTAEVIPGLVAVAGGSFENTDWIDLKTHIYTRSAQKWMTYPSDCTKLEGFSE